MIQVAYSTYSNQLFAYPREQFHCTKTTRYSGYPVCASNNDKFEGNVLNIKIMMPNS